jgi:NAD(P)-dependent dehydrogenase (short-subunit alcohol dehydrogenase family)
MIATMEGRTVVVTGATSGIGKATAEGLARAGANVVVAGRNADRVHAARREISAATGVEVECVVFDLAQLASVASAADEIAQRFGAIRVLVNNAGLMILGRRRTTVDGLELTFAVNHLGPFVLTTRLLPMLRAAAPSRIVNVSSDGYAIAREGLDWEDLQFERSWSGWHAYGASKLCNLYFTTELARRLDAQGITANACHPGLVDTQLGRVRDEDRLPRPPTAAPVHPGSQSGSGMPSLDALGTPISTEEGARTPVYLATSDAVATTTGSYFVEGAPAEPGPVATDALAARRLWEISEQLAARALGADAKRPG